MKKVLKIVIPILLVLIILAGCAWFFLYYRTDFSTMQSVAPRPMTEAATAMQLNTTLTPFSWIPRMWTPRWPWQIPIALTAIIPRWNTPL